MEFHKVAVPCYKADSSTIMAQKRKNILASLINKSPIGFRFHLLGMSTLEELETCDKYWIESIDTGLPVLYGLKDLRFGLDALPVKKEPTVNQFNPELLDNPDLTDVFYNIAYLRKVLQWPLK